MDENQETSAADALTQAAEEAVASQETNTQETEETAEETTEQVAETTEEVVEEPAKEELPEDHKDRSDLGRKLSAYHRRVDEIDNKFDHIQRSLDALQPKEAIEEVSPDEPITRAEAEAIYEARDKKKVKSDQSYNDNYVRTISGLGADLSQTEYDAVLAEMKDITYDPSNNPAMDAEMNFLKAERVYLRKQAAQPADKVNPIKGEKPKDSLGVTTAQTSVTKETKMPKLDAPAQSYVDHVRRRDGDEAADKLLKD